MRKNGRKSEERNYTIQSLFLVFALFAFTLALSGYFLNNDVKADTPPAATPACVGSSSQAQVVLTE